MSMEIIDQLVIPPEVADILKARKTAPPRPSDTRQYPRRYLAAIAVLQYQGGLPAFPRPPRLHSVVVADISRSGLRFLHSEQVYPGELAVVQLAGSKQMRIEIARCRKLAERCFEVGVKFAGARVRRESIASRVPSTPLADGASNERQLSSQLLPEGFVSIEPSKTAESASVPSSSDC